ncbi:hypothetical protein [Nostocoides sp. HKS02]|uniref:hypothetical protein n=1 Tax=Nostocoides sp. HKS02 TaxID=1813880 RepID=UPI0012B44D40|nr:hypothetical protein [Tetrasphaera sp. HKS02]QGN57391.1 hypothetical protein GKE56_05355 [Tetrasphaera sp. HKS02]
MREIDVHLGRMNARSGSTEHRGRWRSSGIRRATQQLVSDDADMIWWLMGFAVVIAALALVLRRRGASPTGSDTLHDAGAAHAPQAFRARQEGTGGMNSSAGAS